MTSKTKKLVLAALFCALGIVCKSFLALPMFSLGTYSQSLGVTPVPVMLSGMLLGPGYGALTGAVVDLAGALINPQGAYFPGFTLSMAIYGALPGLFFLKGPRLHLGYTALAVLAAQTVSSLLLNSAFISLVSGIPFGAAFMPKLVFFAPLYALHLALAYTLYRIAVRFKARPPSA